MTIYSKAVNYRKIYKDHHKSIPRDEQNRSYDIHHIDGNRKNNNISNLVAVSIQEHYDIHLAQGDYDACLKLSGRMKISAEEKSRLARLNVEKQKANGTFPFMMKSVREKIVRVQNELVANKTHHLLSGEIQRRTVAKRIAEGTMTLFTSESSRKLQRKLVEEGRCPFSGTAITDAQKARGTHSSQTRWTCVCCRKEFSINGFKGHTAKCFDNISMPRVQASCVCCREVMNTNVLPQHHRKCVKTLSE